MPDRPTALLAATLAAALVLIIAAGCLARPAPTGPSPSPRSEAPVASPVALSTPGDADGTSPTASDRPELPALQPDRLARVVARGGLPAWERAGARGDQTGLLTAGTLVYLVRSARADASTWWLVPIEAFPAKLGWVGEIADGSPALEPFVPDCPDPAFRLTAAELPDLGIVRLACFGSRPMELTGVLACTSGFAELSVQGAPWDDDQRWCNLDDLLLVSGEPVTSTLRPGGGVQPIGPVVVRGQFDNPGAEHCVATPFGVTLGPNPGAGEPGPILFCRTEFVATDLLRP